MRARAMWFSFLLFMVAAAEVRAADAFLQFLDTFQAEGTCSAGDYVVFDAWPDGSPRTLVASYRVYSDPCTKVLGVFRALRNGRYKRLAVFEYPPWYIELLDLTGNGVPEILVTGPPGNRSAPVAILRWDGARLTKIGESSDYAAYVDLNGDGVLEIVENSSGREYVQRLQHGKYVAVVRP